MKQFHKYYCQVEDIILSRPALREVEVSKGIPAAYEQNLHSENGRHAELVSASRDTNVIAIAVKQSASNEAPTTTSLPHLDTQPHINI